MITAKSLAAAMALVQGADVVPEGAEMPTLMQSLLLSPDLRAARTYILARSETAFGFAPQPDSHKTIAAFESATAAHTLRFAQEAAALTRRHLRDSRIGELEPVAAAALDPKSYAEFALKPAQAEQLIEGLNNAGLDVATLRELQAKAGSVNVDSAQRHFFMGKGAAEEIAKLEKLNEIDLPPSESALLAKADRAARADRFAKLIEEAEKAATTLAKVKQDGDAAAVELARVQRELQRA